MTYNEDAREELKYDQYMDLDRLDQRDNDLRRVDVSDELDYDPCTKTWSDPLERNE